MQADHAAIEKGKDESKSKVFDTAFILLIIAAVTATFFAIKFARQSSSLESKISETSGDLCGPPTSLAGDIVPAFKTVDLQGLPAEITYDGSKRFLLFIFSPACDVCAREISTLNSFLDKATSKNCLVRGISISSLEESRRNLINEKPLFEILIMPDMRTQRAYRVVSIPQIMIVSARGTVEWVNYGYLTREKQAELLEKINAGS
ncbi:MAG: redoxin domain-containing protein [Acidobacteriota bacterium]